MKHIKLLAFSAVLALNACLKVSDAPVTPATSIPFKGTDLKGTLAGESSLQLFNKAFTRLSLAEELTDGAGYTIFAPTDSAMKAAGVDEAAIDQMNIDDLRKLISYQIVIGSLDDRALSEPVTASYVLTLKKTLVTKSNGGSSYQYAPIYVKEDDKLYFNGIAATKRGAAIPATNGYVYPVNAFASQLGGGTLMDIIQSDPDLSLYYQSLLVEDSILTANYLTGDIGLFSNTTESGMYPAILAPTNKAFEDAGFHSIDDIRNYAISTYIGFDENDFVTFHFSPLDSVLKRHVLYNEPLAGAFYYTKSSVRIFYNDLQNPAFNNGKLNTYTAGTGSAFDAVVRYRLPLMFSDVNGEAVVKYGDAPAVLLRNAAYVTTNGSLYKIDKLFYPIIK
jgi:uncharacterized surface protein with fasciclin (FAS1) repeats